MNSRLHIGGYYQHPDEGVIKILSGYYLDPIHQRVSNHWHWYNVETGEQGNGYGGPWPEVEAPPFQVNDLVEDHEGDKAIVKLVHDEHTMSVEWDCRPGHIVRTFCSSFTNLSERVRELDKEIR